MRVFRILSGFFFFFLLFSFFLFTAIIVYCVTHYNSFSLCSLPGKARFYKTVVLLSPGYSI